MRLEDEQQKLSLGKSMSLPLAFDSSIPAEAITMPPLMVSHVYLVLRAKSLSCFINLIFCSLFLNSTTLPSDKATILEVTTRIEFSGIFFTY